MNTLLLRLVGPLQSWGTQSRFNVRDTGLEPSKSGVIGLLCAALGRPRHVPIDDIAALRMGVRVDCEGQLSRDYHTALHIFKASGGIKETELSSRYYLADARFLVGFEGEDLSLLQDLHQALYNPYWPLFLGRKAFVPGEPVWISDGLCAGIDLRSALCTYPWLGSASVDPAEQLRLVIETPDGEDVRRDQPVSFSPRNFAPRYVSTYFIPASSIIKEEVPECTSPN